MTRDRSVVMLDHRSCPPVAVLLDVMSGGGEAIDVERIEQHLLDCSTCLDVVRRHDADPPLVSILRTTASIPEVADDRVDEVLRRLSASTDESTLSPRAEETHDAAPIARLAQYRIDGVLGRGGMGRVYRAHDEVLQRPVAIKVMRSRQARRPDARQRFLNEARIVAGLRHDNIIAIHHLDVATTQEAGEESPYLVMPLLQGESLDAYLARRDALDEAESATIAVQVASALGAAHAAGVVHRDIKPGNIWLETDGEAPRPGNYRVQVLDFGLAHYRDDASDASTSGTPGYMSPEQADGQVVDERSDWFSLGCTLYRMVTGRPPFVGTTLERIRLTRQGTARPVRELNRALSRSFAKLIDDLLARAPSDRPATADEVIRRLRPVRRRRILLAGLAGATLIAWAVWAQLRPPSATTGDESPQVAIEVDELKPVAQPFVQVGSVPGPDRQLPGIAPRIDDGSKRWLASAGTAVSADLVAILGDPRFRMGGIPQDIALSGDGKLLAVATESPTKIEPCIELFDARTGEHRGRLIGGLYRVIVIALSRDGRWLAAGEQDGDVSIWEVATSKRQAMIKAHNGHVRTLEFDATGQKLFTGGADGKMRVWSVVDGSDIGPTLTFKLPNLLGKSDPKSFVGDVAYLRQSPDGSILALGISRSGMQLRRGANWSQIERLPELTYDNGMMGAAFTPDGKHLAYGDYRKLNIWNIPERKLVKSIDVPGKTLAVGDSGKLLLATNERFTDASRGPFMARTYHVIDCRTWDVIRTVDLQSDIGHVYCVIDPESARVASCQGIKAGTPTLGDRIVRVRDGRTGEPLLADVGHTAAVRDLAFTPDGTRLISVSNDKTARIWEVATGRCVQTFAKHSEAATAIAISGDGQRAVSTSSDGSLRVWDIKTGELVQRLDHERLPNRAYQSVLSNDGRVVISVANNSGIVVWDVEKASIARQTRAVTSQKSLVFTPNGQHILYSTNQSIEVWSAATLTRLRWMTSPSTVYQLAALADSKRVASIDRTCCLRIWDIETAQQLTNVGWEGINSSDVPTRLAVQPNGSLIAVNSLDGTVRLFDVANSPPKLVRTIAGLPGEHAACVAFRGDGRLLAIGRSDGTIHMHQLSDR